MITNVLNAYIGDSSVSRLYQGDQLIYDAGHPDILCTYISNGDSSTTPDVYFNTGVVPDFTVKVETKYSCSTNTTSKGLFGSRGSSSNSRYFVYSYAAVSVSGQSINTAKFWCRNAEGYSALVPTVNEPHVLTTYLTYTSASAATEVNCILDGSLTSKGITVSSGIDSSVEMYMFAVNYDGTVNYRASEDTRIYYMKIWRDNNLIRFYIPVLHWTNNQYVPCFYDKVNDSYIYNLGTDDVTYKITDDYVLDYLATGPDVNNTQVSVSYDTGIYVDGTKELSASIKTAAFNATQQQWPLGVVNTTSWNGFVFYVSYSTSSSGYIYGRYNGQNATPNVSSYVSNTPFTLDMCRDLNQKNPNAAQQAKVICYYNGTKYESSGYSANPSNSANIYLLTRNRTEAQGGPQLTTSGLKLYYATIADSNNPLRSYVPVLHNNQACFLDLNSNTYIYNLGTDTPSYSF